MKRGHYKYRLLQTVVVLLSCCMLLVSWVKDPALQVYQFSVKVGSSRAYLWIPPGCDNIRAVMIGLNNLTERRWLEDPIIRKMAAKEGIGIIWVGPKDKTDNNTDAYNLEADMSGNSKEALLNMLSDFASTSGYPEIAQALLIPTGHSAHGHFSWKVAGCFPDRTLAAIAVKTIPLPDTLGFKNIPLLYLLGQTTEWPQYKDGRLGDRDFYPPVVRSSATGLRERTANNLISVVVEPGGGHFDWSEKLAGYMALFIEKAFRYRVPKDIVNYRHNKYNLKPVLPASGWLLIRKQIKEGSQGKASSQVVAYAQYKGDKSEADWFMDKQLAIAAKRLEKVDLPQKKQMPTVLQENTLLNVTKLGFANAKFIPDLDGVTFRLTPGFLNSVPKELVQAGNPLGNAGHKVYFSVITGPALQTGNHTFKVHFDRAGFDDIWIEEKTAGNKQYRRAVQPVRVRIAPCLTRGKAQAINFPRIPDQKKGVRAIRLAAVSDAGLPIQYSVVFGPAYIQGDQLIFTKIPVKSRFPIKILVRAYQWGRDVAPYIQSATTVTRSFSIWQ